MRCYAPLFAFIAGLVIRAVIDGIREGVRK